MVFFFFSEWKVRIIQSNILLWRAAIDAKEKAEVLIVWLTVWWFFFFKKTHTILDHPERRTGVQEISSVCTHLVLHNSNAFIPSFTLFLENQNVINSPLEFITKWSMAWNASIISKRNCTIKHRHFYRFFALLLNFFNNCLSEHQVDLLGLQRELQNFSGTPLYSELIDSPVCLSLTADTHLEGFSFWTAAETLFYLILILMCQNPSPCCLECSGTSAWCEAVVCLRAEPAAHLSWLGSFQGQRVLDIGWRFWQSWTDSMNEATCLQH